MRGIATIGVAGLVALLATPALAVSPGPPVRDQILFDAAAGTCSGLDPSLGTIRCVEDAQCNDGTDNVGVCSVGPSDIVLRAVVTLIVDKDSAGWNDTSYVPNVVNTNVYGREDLIPSDVSKSTFTVLVEFTHAGRKTVLAETYQDLGPWVDPSLVGDCPAFCAYQWREPVTETQMAGAAISGTTPGGGGSGGMGGGGTGGGNGVSAPSSGIRINFGLPGKALHDAIVSAVGLPAGTTAWIDITDTTQIFDHSAETDTLGTVHRLKANIRFYAPKAP